MSTKTTDIDRKIGALIRKHREGNGWTQMALAAEIGVTYQQLQKYEKSVSRVSASRLYKIAKELNVPVASFFLRKPLTLRLCLIRRT